MNLVKRLKIACGAALIFSTAIWAGSASAQDIVHLNDVIIDGSLCVGQDCVNGESFGFDTIRIKENNLRIHFQDTSSTAAFPSNDWRIIANDASNGGANYLAIQDSTAGRQVFRVEAGAPQNALTVDAQGDVGIGLMNAVVDLQIRTGNTPTLRLEQDGSSGFTPQTWDVAGNEANLFIRDATSGSTLPFRIFPGAPSNALTIEGSTGDIGMGTTSPSAALHILDNAGTTGPQDMLRLANNGNPQIILENTSNGNEWELGGGQNLVFEYLTTPLVVMTISPVGNVTIPGTITTGGVTCGGGCDLVFEEDYELLSIDEHAHKMWSMKHLPNVGPTVENQPFNLSEKTGRMLNELELAHIYIAQLHKRLEALETERTDSEF